MKTAVALSVLLLSSVSVSTLAPSKPQAPAVVPPHRNSVDGFARLPLRFELNRGQADSQVKFLCRTAGYTLYLTSTEAVMSLPDSSVRIRLVGAADQARIEARDLLPGTTNYFLGNDPKRWRTNIPSYAKVTYREVYPGVDLVYYGKQHSIEYDFVIAPGVDPGVIRIAVEGAREIKLNETGDLVLATGSGNVIQRKPRVWQQSGREKSEITGAYALQGPSQVALVVKGYDRKLPLVVDPEVVYATYLGGNDFDIIDALAVSQQGDVYVTGLTRGDFPLTPGAVQSSVKGNSDAFVARLNAAGSALVYATYLGSSIADSASDIAVDVDGNAYVTGSTGGGDFPTTPGALQPKSGGGSDAFVSKLNATGTALLYSTYLGGSGNEAGSEIAVDTQGNAHVTGSKGLCSSSFATTPGVYRASPGWCDGFLAKLNAAGSGAVFSTDVGGQHIALDSAGNVYLAGYIPDRFSGLSSFPTTSGAFRTNCRRGDYASTGDAFIAKLDRTGSTLVYATCFAGNITDLAVDNEGNAYVTGTTNSPDFTTTPGTLAPTGNKGCNADLDQGWNPMYDDCDIFVTKMNVIGTDLVYSTYVAVSDPINGYSRISLDAEGNAYIAGNTYKFDQFPTTPGSFPATMRWQGFLLKVNADASAVMDSTRLASAPISLAVDAKGTAYLAGSAFQQDEFSATPGAFESSFSGGDFDGFVMKLIMRESPIVPVFESHGVVGGASFLPGPIAPGELVTIYGTGFGPPQLTTLELGSNGRVSSLLGWTRILFDGIPAPMIWSAQNQLTAVVPYALAGKASAQVQIEYLGNKSDPAIVTLASAAPGIFTANSSGTGQGAIVNANASSFGHIEINSPANPAPIGSIVSIYATGAGQTSPPAVDGDVPNVTFPIPVLPVEARIGGIKAEVVSATAAPGVVSGVVQANVRVPEGISAGPAVPVVLLVGGVSSQPGVTMAVK